MLRDELREQYSRDIASGMGLLSKRNFSFTPMYNDRYDRNQYKLISEESMREGDFASGSSTTNKGNLIGAAEFLEGRKLKPYAITYKEGLTSAHYDLGDLKGYGKDEIHQMIRAVQDYGLKNTNADLIEVSYHNGYKKNKKGEDVKNGVKKETTARDNSSFEIEPVELSVENAINGMRERARFRELQGIARGAVPTSANFQTNDVIREFSDNMRKIVERALNGGASSSTINRIAEDVSAIRGAISNGSVKISNTTNNANQNTGMFETSRMAAVDDAEAAIEAERERRRIAASGFN